MEAPRPPPINLGVATPTQDWCLWL